MAALPRTRTGFETFQRVFVGIREDNGIQLSRFNYFISKSPVPQLCTNIYIEIVEVKYAPAQ